MAIRVDTAAVRAAADKIRTINMEIDTEFTSVEAAVKKLIAKWHGTAAEQGINYYYDLKNELVPARLRVIDQMANFLLVQVGLGYEETEKAISSAADAFK